MTTTRMPTRGAAAPDLALALTTGEVWRSAERALRAQRCKHGRTEKANEGWRLREGGEAAGGDGDRGGNARRHLCYGHAEEKR